VASRSSIRRRAASSSSPTDTNERHERRNGAHSRARQEADLDRHGPAMSAWFEDFLDTLFDARAESKSEQAAE
jgi:hypothetical protein